MLINKFFRWSALALILGAYVPLVIGGWQQPADINIVCYAIWTFLALLAAYSMRRLRYDGWPLMVGCVIGDLVMLILGLRLGGAFSLDTTAAIGLSGIALTLAVWTTYGQISKRWEPRILYLGLIATDVLSFIPMGIQLFLPHPPPTVFCLVGWSCWTAGYAINVFGIDRLVTKLRMAPVLYEATFGQPKTLWGAIEPSIIPAEIGLLNLATVLAMMLS
jgi:hypothetical protein